MILPVAWLEEVFSKVQCPEWLSSKQVFVDMLPLLIQSAGFIQLHIATGEIPANLLRLRRALEELNPPKQSLIILPELWGTGFAYDKLSNLQQEIPKIYEELQKLAECYDILIGGSLPEQVAPHENLYYNTLEIIGGKGTFGKYRKHHLFPGEEIGFCGWTNHSPPIATPVGTFGCMICFDLRFPDIARAQCQQGADMLVCSAQWPISRIQHWRTLVVARAIENQTYIVACNGVGKNGEQTLGGHSLIVSPSGTILYEAGESESAAVVPINWQEKSESQIKFRSFSANPYQLSAQMKILPSNICMTEAIKRSLVGQKLILLVVEKNIEVLEALEVFEKNRMDADFLIVGIRLPQEEGVKSFSDRKKTLKLFAGFGCVNAIVDLCEMPQATEHLLRNMCRTVTF